MGVVLFITSKIANISFEAMSRAIMPWLVPLLAVLVTITVRPPLTTWLPKLVMGRCTLALTRPLPSAQVGGQR